MKPIPYRPMNSPCASFRLGSRAFDLWEKGEGQSAGARAPALSAPPRYDYVGARTRQPLFGSQRQRVAAGVVRPHPKERVSAQCIQKPPRSGCGTSESGFGILLVNLATASHPSRATASPPNNPY